MPDPIAVLRKMHRWTKPGGYIVAQECDFGTVESYPEMEAAAEFREGIVRRVRTPYGKRSWA